MRLIIPFLGKRKVDDDDFWEDVEQFRQMTLKSIGPTRYVESTGKKLKIITTNTPASTAANPESGPSNEGELAPMKEETRRERWRRLKAELERLKR